MLSPPLNIHHSIIKEEQTVRTQIDWALMADSAAHTFYWKYDQSQDDKYKLYTGLAKAAIMTVFVVLGAVAAPAAVPALAGTMPAIEASTLKSSAYLASTLVEGDALERSICANFAHPDKGLPEAAKLQIEKTINGFIQDYRSLAQDTRADIVREVDLLTDSPIPFHSTLFTEVIESGHYLQFTKEQNKRFTTATHLIEDNIKQKFTNSLISTILKSQICYIQCTPVESKGSNLTHFSPEPGKFCKAKYWKNRSGQNPPDYMIKGADSLCDIFKDEITIFKQARADRLPLKSEQSPDLDCHICYDNTIGKYVRLRQDENLYYKAGKISEET
ncbi:MAG: hypothetical protein Q9166_000659 [cf. Caloplaca sp. 2 TL-2023]